MKRIVPIILLGLLVPQLAMAAWYNPLSWFSGSSTPLDTQTIDETSKESEVDKIVFPQLDQVTTPPKENNQYIESLVSQITLLKRENEELRSKLNSCQMPTITNNTNNALKIIDATELDKQSKLKKIDQEILAIIDYQLDIGPVSEERCNFLAARISKYKYGSNTLAYQEYEADCKKKHDVSKINELLGAYRVVDSKMTYENIPASFDEIKKLESYLINTYIEYR